MSKKDLKEKILDRAQELSDFAEKLDDLYLLENKNEKIAELCLSLSQFTHSLLLTIETD